MQNLSELWSLEAEAAVLGSIMLDSSCAGEVLPILPAEEMFFKDEHRDIYAALMQLYTAKQPTDAIALRTELRKENKLEKIGGVEYISKILDSVPSAADAVYYAGVVRDRYRYRKLISDIEQMQYVLGEPLGVDEQIQRVQDIALGLETSKPESDYVTFAERIVKVAEAMPEHTETIPTGFRNIDRIIQGVAPGEFIIVGGRTSMGKSAVALDIMLNMAEKGKSVVFFTNEMSYEALMERALCNRAEVNMTEVKSGFAIDERLEKIHETALELERLDIVLHGKGVTPEVVIAFIRTRKKTHKVDVVFVDYLQLMNAGRRTENRVQEISAISRKLKLAAVQEQVPIVAISQLNRRVETRTGHRPMLSDLRESGALEQDADVVILLHREDYYRRNENPDTTAVDGKTEAVIAKNRRGPVGIANLTFLEESVRFGDGVLPHITEEAVR